MKPNTDNPKGFGESVAFQHFHDRLLTSAGSDWMDWAPLNPDWKETLTAVMFDEAAGQVYQEEFGDAALVAIKDPRICRFASFWLDHLDRAGIRPLPIIAFRNPLEVAASLQKRNLLPASQGALLWMRHVLDAELATRGRNRVFVNYHDVLADWRAVANQIRVKLSVPWPRFSRAVELEIDEFVEKALHREVVPDDAALSRRSVAEWVRRTYAELLNIAKSGESAASSDVFDQIRGEFDSASRVFGLVMRDVERNANAARHQEKKVSIEAAAMVEKIALAENRLAEMEAERDRAIQRAEKLRVAKRTPMEHAEVHAAELVALKGRLSAREEATARLGLCLGDAENKLAMAHDQLAELKAERDALKARVDQPMPLSSVPPPEARPPMDGSASSETPQVVELMSLRTAHEDLEETEANIRRLIESMERDLAIANQSAKRAQQLTAASEVHARGIKALESEPETLRRVSAEREEGDADHPLAEQVLLIRVSGLFDEPYYRQQLDEKHIALSGDPALHYLTEGSHLNPHPLFDSAWYIKHCSVASESIKNPLLHYLTADESMCADPHPLFASSWYAGQNPEIDKLGLRPLAHYIGEGWKSGRKPNELFDPAWYLETYADVAESGIEPLTHFVLHGSKEQRNPSAQFDANWYLGEHRDVAKAGLEPLTHFLHWGISEKRTTRAISNGVSSAEKPLLSRKMKEWDWSREADFKNAILTVDQRNAGYFDRVPVSVVMPTYNRASTVATAIRSVLAQSHRNLELIIVDDDSTDDTAATVKEFLLDPRVKYEQISHCGVSGARNHGLGLARGDIVFYLDSDNSWKEDFLKVMAVFIISGNLDAAYCGIQIVDDQGSTLAYRGDNFGWLACYNQNYVDMNCFGHRRIPLAKYRFDQSLRRLVDWDFILRVTARGRTAFAPYCGVIYYDGKGGARITLTEYQGEQLKSAEGAIRRKHTHQDIEGNENDDLRPRWEDIASSLTGGILNDEHSLELVRLGGELIDWQSVRRRERIPNLVSIVILCFNNAALTKKCIESVLNCACADPFSIEVLAVDNGSSDNTAEVLEALSASDSRVKIFAPRKNLMFSLGNNFGLAEASGEYAVILNNDTEVVEGWLSPLVDSLRLDPTIGLVGPKLLYPDETLQCGGLVFSDRSKTPYHIYRGFGRHDEWVNKARTFQAITGACMAARTEDLLILQCFDPVYINGAEDLDLCFRMRTVLKKRSLYNPRSEVFHLESKSEGRGRHIARNRAKFVARWGGCVVADDVSFYEEDGFRPISYIKPGKEPDGPTAAYTPVLEGLVTKSLERASTEEGSREGRVFNVGFSTIWHARGIAFQTMQLADALEGQGFQTHIFARWESAKFSNDGPIEHARVFNAGDDPPAEEVVRWARQNNIDLVIFMEVHPKDWKRVAALKGIGIPVVCYENLDVLRWDKLINYSQFDLFLFNCFHSREVLLSQFPSARSLMIPWGARVTSDDVNAPFPDDIFRFVHVAGWGGLNNRKNTGLVIKAFDRAYFKNAELHIYTQTPLSSYGEDVQSIARSSSRIQVYEGTIDDIHTAYLNKSMLLWPSKREGVGLPIVEALAHGLPVLVSDGYMMKQWVIKGVHGEVCRGKPTPGIMVLPEIDVDEEGLVSALSHLLADGERVRQMRSNIARDKEIWKWDWQSTVFQRQLRELLCNKAYRPPEDLSYLPADVLEFEFRRRASYVT